MGAVGGADMTDTPVFVLAGDQSLDSFSCPGRLTRSNVGTLARVFADDVARALRTEIQALPEVDRRRIPKFRNLQQLNQRYHNQPLRHAAVDAALNCAAQIMDYLQFFEDGAGCGSSAASPYIIGLSTGMFAAFGIATAPSPSVLVRTGLLAVIYAFKTGLYVHTLAERIHPTFELSEPWAYLIPGQSYENTLPRLDKFQDANEIPPAGRAYISAVGPSGVIVSGPPATLRLMIDEGLFPITPRALPIHGPYHAPHLHARVDVDKVIQLVDPTLEDGLEDLPPRSPVMSGTTGTWLSAPDAKRLIKDMVREVLTERLMFTSALNGCLVRASQLDSKRCLVLPLGTTRNSETLAAGLKQHAGLDVTVWTPPRLSEEQPELIRKKTGPGEKCKLAVVGMAGRFPDAASHEKLWELLAKGLDVHRPVPPDRFNVNTHVDTTLRKANTSHTPYGCWIEEPGLFDSRFFNMSPREATQTDPMQRMALMTAYEALEMSGYVPNRTPSTRLDRIGTFYGQTSDDWREINAAQNVDTYFITGGVRAFGPGRINYHFGFSGPSLNIDTACSSSAAALQVACTALWAGDCDTAIVGGLSCMTNPDIFAGLSRGGFLSRKGPCATFDQGADGYCRGDGCASVVVKRLDDAFEDQDPILAVILGTATNHSADAISITHPHGPTQSELSRSILEEASVDPLDIDYVEMHGTGTQAGDNTEMVSVTNVFAPADRKRPADRPLYLGAVKANVGHGEAASGVTALIKVLMMLQKNAIPPHVGIKPGSVMNKSFPSNLSERNVNIAFHLTPFERRGNKPRRVFINNFSAAGGNTGLLLEEAPAPPSLRSDPRTYHVVSVTAKSKASMIRNAENLVKWMEDNPDTPLAHVAYTTTARRIQHYWRLAVTGASLSEVQQAIRKKLKGKLEPVDHQNRRSVVMLFTGQGSQYAGLGKKLYEHHSVFRQAIDEFNVIAQAHGFPSFVPLVDGSEPDINKLPPIVVQLGLVCVEMALARLWTSWGMKPDVVVGHSLGEYAALEYAGVLSASDAIYLVGARARLLMSHCTPGTHTMLAVRASLKEIEEVVGSRSPPVTIACLNGPAETVVSGETGEMMQVMQILSASGISSTQLHVPFAFHSPQVDAILDDFGKLAAGVRYKPPRLPVVSPLLGEMLGKDTVNPRYLQRHARETVNFHAGMMRARAENLLDDKSVFLEVGPHPVCTGMLKNIIGASSIAVASLHRRDDCYKTLSNSLCMLHNNGFNLDFNEYHRDFKGSVRALTLPSYAFDQANYWIQYNGDWCLSKNELSKQAGAASPIATTTVQKVVSSEVRGEMVTLETESDLCEEKLRDIVSGHLVNGAPLCPSSLYADMAMTACDFAYKLARPNDTARIGCNVAHMEVPQTLIFQDKAEKHILRLSVKADIKEGFADLVFHTEVAKQKKTHALCKVYYGKVDEWQGEFDRAAYLVRSRIEALKDAEKRGAASKIGRGLVYKLFSALVDYAPRYRGMEEVILDSATCEATAKINFQTSPEDGHFVFSPYHIDSVCHISGFIINGTDAIDSREHVYISHGWGSMRFTEIPVSGKEYRSYIRMQPLGDSKVMIGDAYVFNGDSKLIGIAGDIKFQCIPRRVLDTMLPPRGRLSAPRATAPQARTPPSVPTAAPEKGGSAGGKKKKETVTPSTIGKVSEKLRGATSQIMEILAREIGCNLDELADSMLWNDFGVDSLMGLTVSAKIREELELEVPSQSFIDYPTVGAFKAYVTGQFEKPGRKASISSRDSGMSSDMSRAIDFDSNVTTPLDESETESDKDDERAQDGQSEGLQPLLRRTIVEEAGVHLDEIMAAPNLKDLGIDSLMAISILGKIREETGIDLPSDLFVANTTFQQVEHALGFDKPPTKKKAAPKTKKAEKKHVSAPSSPGEPARSSPRTSTRPSSRASAPSPTSKHPRIGLEEPAPPRPPRPTSIIDHYPDRKASSILLSGKSNSEKCLWMVPDGGGAPTSYTELAKIGGKWAVRGLISPFLKTPDEYKCGVYGMATKFIEEIKRHQPRGPYSLSGWSAGGVIAYEMVVQLVEAGEEVENLVIVDAPCPVTIEPLPQGLHAWFASIGLLGESSEGKPSERKIPSWLLPHFAASVTALSNYNAKPIPKGKCPNVLTIWCEDGVCKLPTDPRPEPYPKGHALFLLDNRSDFGPNRWDEYLDIEKMRFKHMPGNHFSMMTGTLGKQLCEFFKEFLL
ncbi:hypothetical protein VTK26DRAFT_5418 [Humicola hyalothermophila]